MTLKKRDLQNIPVLVVALSDQTHFINLAKELEMNPLKISAKKCEKIQLNLQ